LFFLVSTKVRQEEKDGKNLRQVISLEHIAVKTNSEKFGNGIRNGITCHNDYGFGQNKFDFTIK